jgi:uncharacterized protein (TIGR02145 family)
MSIKKTIITAVAVAAVTVGASVVGCGGKGNDRGKAAATEHIAGTFTDTTFTDGRDGRTYRTVKIGGQTWMAENLNYKTDSSWCYKNSASNCNAYGRLYSWNAAMKACPAGWHLPSEEEWEELFRFVNEEHKHSSRGSDGSDGTYNDAYKKLKSKRGWGNISFITSVDNGNGTDDYGFRAMPGGIFLGQFSKYWCGFHPAVSKICNYAEKLTGYYFSFHCAGIYGSWWSSSNLNDIHSSWNSEKHCIRTYTMSYNDNPRSYNPTGLDGKTDFNSVRCLRD